MSNFLDQFKPGVYDRNKIHIGTEKSEKKVMEMDDLESTSTYQDEERFYVREEETELDPSYKAKNKKRWFLSQSVWSYHCCSSVEFGINNLIQ